MESYEPEDDYEDNLKAAFKALNAAQEGINAAEEYAGVSLRKAVNRKSQNYGNAHLELKSLSLLRNMDFNFKITHLLLL